MIGRSLGCRIRRMRLIFRPLRKETSVRLQRTIHLIGGNMVKQFAVIISLPRQLSRLQQTQRTHHIRLRKSKRILNRTIHMAFRCQMNHTINLILCKYPLHSRKIANIRLHKRIIRTPLHIPQIRQIPGIRQLIQIHNPVLRILIHQQADQMGTDKPSPTRNQYIPFHNFKKLSVILSNASLHSGTSTPNSRFIFVLSKAE